MRAAASRWFWRLSCLLAIAGAEAGRAVVIAGGDGLGNTNAPPDDPGWANVGQFNVGQNSAVYLGNRWVLTAWHVYSNDQPTQVRFGGTWYPLESNTWTRITNSSGTFADMVLVRTQTAPPLPDVTLRSSQIPDNAQLVMIGNGRQRHPTNSYWNSSWQETNAAGAVYTGFKMTTGSLQQRWGLNTIDNPFKSVNVFDLYYMLTTTSFRVTFNDDAGPNEAQAVIGDSGGPVFYKSGATWELVGMLYNVGVEPGQPWPSAIVYGNRSWAANLTTAVYYDQLAAAIPEPGIVGMGALAAGVLQVFRRLRRRLLANGEWSDEGPADLGGSL
ncbi:MAG: trypsin-like peptidase domain-containing protein [Kiritimatiellae bacterium]|nr:trypsin-like peptidase domain-containing protein [Kiritimatiellia bacterium]